MKIGILGLGQAGGKIAQTLNAIAPDLYSSLAINLAQQDLDALNLSESRKLHLRWKVQGAGRDPKVPYQALRDSVNQQAFLDKMNEVFGTNLEADPDFKFKVDFLLITLGAGGGTGNGFLQALIDSGLLPLLPPIGVVLATPRQIDSYQEQQNTAILIQKVNESLKNEDIHTVFLVNNEKYSNVQNESYNWMSLANQHFSKQLTDFFKQTTKPSTKSLDEADLSNMLQRFYGYSTVNTKIGIPNDAIDKTVVALEKDGYSVKTASAIAVMVVGKQAEHHENKLLTKIREIAPNASQYVYTGFYNVSNLEETKEENLIMLSRMDTPQYILSMIDGLKTFLDKSQSQPRFQSLDLNFLQQTQGRSESPKKKEIIKFKGFKFD